MVHVSPIHVQYDTTGYSVTENLLSGPTFSVDVQCADGYETSDTLSATACTTNGPYTINGTCIPYTCTYYDNWI